MGERVQRTGAQGGTGGRTGGGAYGLFVVLRKPLAVTLAGRPPVGLAPGRYLYAGSAWGPGGLAARLARHRRRDKAIHWHIDRITAVAGVAAAVGLPGGRECAIVAALSAWPGVDVPVPGFGSTDCRTCPSHLLRLPDDAEPDAVVGRLVAAGMPQAALWPAPGQ